MTDDIKECYIVGGGPSLTNFDWDLLKGKFVIAINRAYEVLPEANILYFTDPDYWQLHKDAMKKHGGKLIRGVLRLGETKDPQVQEYHLTGSRGLELTPGCLKHGNNSTHAAINLAGVHLKIPTIYLMGIDMQWSKDKKQTHWHSGHRRIDPERGYDLMIQGFNVLRFELPKHNIKVININNTTALPFFPVVSYQAHFGENCFKVPPQA